LKDGSVLKGEIVEIALNDYLKIKLKSGTVVELKYSDIEKIEKGTSESTKNTNVDLKQDIKQEQHVTVQVGNDVAGKRRYHYKNPTNAAILEFFVPVAGQVYAAREKSMGLFKGLGFLIARGSTGVLGGLFLSSTGSELGGVGMLIICAGLSYWDCKLTYNESVKYNIDLEEYLNSKSYLKEDYKFSGVKIGLTFNL